MSRPVRTMRKRSTYDLHALPELPPGRRRAVEALIGGEPAQTHVEAAQLAGVAEGTLLAHVSRVRRNHPQVYADVRAVRLAQLARRSRLDGAVVDRSEVW